MKDVCYYFYSITCTILIYQTTQYVCGTFLGIQITKSTVQRRYLYHNNTKESRWQRRRQWQKDKKGKKQKKRGVF